MAIDADKSFEVSEDGIKFDSGTGLWIGAGDAVPTHNAPEGSRYYRTSPEEEYIQEGPGETNNWVLFVASGGGGYAVKFGSNSNSSAGKWLEIHRNVVSNESPFIVPSDGELQEISVGVKVSSTATFGVYKNGTQIETIVLTAQTKNNKIGLTHALLALDEISVKIESGTTSDPILHIIIG